jgi:UDPglucose 6-dehydrogenase
MSIGIIGYGFVGKAIYESFKLNNISVYVYDKHKTIDSFESCLATNMLFLCLPTPFVNDRFNINTIIDTCDLLEQNNYNGIIIIKSTIEVGTTEMLYNKYQSKLKFIHNPEFLSARTAFTDFHNQYHIVLGGCCNNDLNKVVEFYNNYYPSAEISVCSSKESESMKLYCNAFYAVKIQFFNELFEFSSSMDCNFDRIRDLMLKNKWINPMHTNVPGQDGLLSYGGACFPKDTNALLNHMKRIGTSHMVLEATVKERDIMRTY